MSSVTAPMKAVPLHRALELAAEWNKGQPTPVEPEYWREVVSVLAEEVSRISQPGPEQSVAQMVADDLDRMSNEDPFAEHELGSMRLRMLANFVRDFGHPDQRVQPVALPYGHIVAAAIFNKAGTKAELYLVNAENRGIIAAAKKAGLRIEYLGRITPQAMDGASEK